MNFTSKSRYALKIMMDLASHQHIPHVHRKDIAHRQGIPTEYLDQIMMRLRGHQLVESVRGRGGGYRLMKSATDISMWDLFLAAEGSLEPVQCISDEACCEFDGSCISKSPWQKIFGSVRQVLEKQSLADLMEQEKPPQHLMCPGAGIRECRAPAGVS